MSPTRKIVKTYLITLGQVGIFFFVVVVGTLLYGISPVGLLFFFDAYTSEIYFSALSIFLFVLVCKAYRNTKHTENPWQTIRENLSKNITVFLSIVFIIYCCVTLLATIFPTVYGRCDYYNKELNGGVIESKGKRFNVNLCGTGDYDGKFNYRPDKIRLQIFNENGNLVAQRHFEVDWHMGSQMVLEFHPDHITYYDFSAKNFEKTISMPPTTIDWIRARIPLLD